ncbi:hypothetical protein T265_11240 [Opisthorchis viverrini]|uniref:Uncharacterized protein n=1 Tax=Opisthorchis viverrini TaxID=6198 RepID=A0A074YZT2_OPIVI|nr:hypothetical protein T265_11240 [Opisthorchis viverrini]KER20158.1 hypothetical protein T265_11240 [Opisthorchis viverrini]
MVFSDKNLHQGYRSAVAAIRCLTAMRPEGSTRARILPSCPSLDRESREAGVGFGPRTIRSSCLRSSNHMVFSDKNLHQGYRSAVAAIRCLTAMRPEGSTRARILPSCPSLDRESREAGVGFGPRTIRSVNLRPNH